MKKCTFCRRKQPFSEFHPKGNGNFMSRCKTCMINIQAIKYQKNKKVNVQMDAMRLEQRQQEIEKQRSKILERWAKNERLD